MAGVDVRISELPAATEGHPDDRFETTQVDGATLVSRSITLEQVSDAVAAVLPPPTADWDSITGKPATFPPTTPIPYTSISGTPSSLPPSGTAGGDLSGTYPNPTIKPGTNTQILTTVGGVAAWAAAPSSAPSGAAGGDLSGSYPNPTIKANVALTGNPTAPTPTAGDNDTSIATTAFVTSAVAGVSPTLAAKAVGYGSAGNVLTGVAADFNWDATNKRLGVGAPTPAYTVHVQNGGNDLFTVDNSGIVGTAGAVRALLPFAWQAGGQWWSSITIGTTSGGYLGLYGGTGVPTASTFGAYGTLYVNASSPGVPYYNSNGGTGWTMLAPITATGTTAPANPVDGQLWYYSDASAGGGALYVRYNDGSSTAWVPASPAATPGSLIQTVFTETGAVATGTTTIPFDDTIPQISEGTEFMTCSITPKSATSKLIIDVTAQLVAASAAAQLVGCLFRDAAPDALATQYALVTTGGAGTPLRFTHAMTSGGTSAITFRFRAGCNGGNTVMNGQAAGTRLFGGSLASSIVIREVA